MKPVLHKIELCLKTYWRAWLAVRRQYDSEGINRAQNKKLRTLIRFCFENVPYYQEKFKHAGITPDQIKTAVDLRSVPLLCRKELRDRFWDLFPTEVPTCRISRTSGSTGLPVCIFSDRNSRMCNSAAVIRYRVALGIGFLGRSILTPLLTKPNEPYLKKPHWTFLQGIHKTYYINPYIDRHDNIEYALRLLPRLKNPALIGVTSAVGELVYRIRDGVFPLFRPSIVLTTSEMLHPEVRDLLESTFNTEVADIYACNEAGDVAWQCTRNLGYHINSDNVIVEILKDDKPVEVGQVGEVVITNLSRLAMPIIRYKTGDLARLASGQCSCGCKLPMMAEIVGRTGDNILLPDGRIIPWKHVRDIVNHPQVRLYQIVQSAKGDITVKYVPEPNTCSGPLKELLLFRCKNLFGTSITVKVDEVETIPSATSGKRKFVVSRYRHADQTFAPPSNLGNCR